MANSVIEIKDSTFEAEVKNQSGVVLVDFWAPWCGPCRMIGPIVEDIAEEYGDKMKVCKVNVDENTEIATSFSITAIPTLIVFKDGEIAERIQGAVPKMKIKESIDKAL